MLIAKSKLRLQGHISELDAFPNTEQWLQIVGFTDRSLRVSLALLFEFCCTVDCLSLMFTYNSTYDCCVIVFAGRAVKILFVINFDED